MRTRNRRRPLLANPATLLWLLALIAAGTPNCGASSGSGETSIQAGSGAGSAPTFSEIYPMLFPATTEARCNFCHSMPASDTSNGNLSLGMDQTAAHAALVGKSSMSSKCMGKPLVVAGQPDMSLLLGKLSANPPCGTRMPLGGKPLSDVQLSMIRSWISAGAKDD